MDIILIKCDRQEMKLVQNLPRKSATKCYSTGTLPLQAPSEHDDSLTPHCSPSMLALSAYLALI